MNKIRTMKIFDMRQMNTLIAHGAKVLSVNISPDKKVYTLFEANEHFQELMKKWQNKKI
jgi:hypothetical protein